MRRKPPKRPRVRRGKPSDKTGHVGYGHPPEEHRFKPGESGNPRGRPKGVKNHNTILHEILHRKLPIRDRGTVRQVPLIEAMLLKFAEEALRGNPKAAAFLLNRYAPAEEETSSTELTREDQEILDAFAASIKSQPKNKEA